MKLGLPIVSAVLLLQGLGMARVSACQYCEMASDPSMTVYLPPTDPAAAPSAAATPGAVPTSALPPTVRSAAPLAVSVATRASDLPLSLPLAAKRAARRLSTSSAPANDPRLIPVVDSVGTISQPATRRPFGAGWADVGLLGMAAGGGFFCWRTRRTAEGGTLERVSIG